MRATFQPGTTTRADVVLALGEPDWISSDESRLVYRARIVDSYFFIYLVGGLGVVVWGTMQSDAFEFDRRGALLGHRCVEQSFTGSGDGGPLWPRRPDGAEMEALFAPPVR